MSDTATNIQPVLPTKNGGGLAKNADVNRIADALNQQVPSGVTIERVGPIGAVVVKRGEAMTKPVHAWKKCSAYQLLINQLFKGANSPQVTKLTHVAADKFADENAVILDVSQVPEAEVATIGGYTTTGEPIYVITAPKKIKMKIISATVEVANGRWLYKGKVVGRKLSAGKTYTDYGDEYSLRNEREGLTKGGYADTSVSGIRQIPIGAIVDAEPATDSDGTLVYMFNQLNEPLITC